MREGAKTKKLSRGNLNGYCIERRILGYPELKVIMALLLLRRLHKWGKTG
jgi:hypothetical protein